MVFFFLRQERRRWGKTGDIGTNDRNREDILHAFKASLLVTETLVTQART